MAQVIRFFKPLTSLPGPDFGFATQWHYSEVFDVTDENELWADMRVYGAFISSTHTSGVIETAFGPSHDDDAWVTLASGVVTDVGSVRLHATGLGAVVRARVHLNIGHAVTLVFAGVARDIQPS